MRLRILVAAVCAAVCAAAALAALATIVSARHDDRPRTLTVALENVNGATVGRVVLSQRTARSPVDVRASVRRLRPAFHGFHVHAVGRCEPPTFASAGGHLKAADEVHGAHAGDLSSLLVKRNGTATLRLTTDRFALADLRDADGSAVVVHAERDNFANIPPRYAANGADATTLDTGDSGARLACGEIQGR